MKIHTLYKIKYIKDFCLLLLLFFFSFHVNATDYYATPSGAGSQNGSSWANAIPGSNIESFINNNMVPGDRLLIDDNGGAFNNLEMTITNSGTSGNMITIDGLNYPLFKGTGTGSRTCITLNSAASYLNIKGLRIEDYERGIESAIDINNPYQYNIIEDLRLHTVYHGFYLRDFRNSEIKNCIVTKNKGRGFYLRDGCRNLQIMDCLVDNRLNDVDYALSNFSVGFECRNQDGRFSSDPYDITNIVFTRCEARNHFNDRDWTNGDGFLINAAWRDIKFYNCISHGNADGGWDDKGYNTYYENCISVGNGENFRARIKNKYVNCLSVNPTVVTYSSHGNGLLKISREGYAEIEMYNCTFHNGYYKDEWDQPDAIKIAEDCIFSETNSWPITDGDNGSGNVFDDTPGYKNPFSDYNPTYFYDFLSNYYSNLTTSLDNYDNTDYSGKGYKYVAPGDPPVISNLAANPTSGDAPLLVQFDVTADDPDGNNTNMTYSWDFGDGGASSTEDPSNTYDTPGNYTANIVVTDEDGQTTSDNITISVTGNYPPEVSFSIPGNEQRFAPNAVVDLKASASDQDGSIDKVEFYDGTTLLATDNNAPYEHSINGLSVGVHTLEARVYDNDGATSEDYISISAVSISAAEIGNTATAPSIDGNVDALWDSQPANSIDNVVLGTVNGTGDLSGTWKAVWDATNLYVLIDVNDDSKINDSGADFWHDDGVELYLDVNYDHETSYGSDDYQLVVRYNDSELYGNRTSGLNPVIAQADKSGGYRVEFALPWTDISGYTPQSGMLLGIDAGLNDDDDGGNRDSQIFWNSTSGNAHQDPSLFGAGKLTGDTPPPPTYTLTVNSGSGDGDYAEASVVNISADAAPGGQQFASWTGDISHVADANSANTTVTMPASNVSVTATYEDEVTDQELALTLDAHDGFDIPANLFDNSTSSRAISNSGGTARSVTVSFDPATITRVSFFEDNGGNYNVDSYKIEYYDGSWNTALDWTTASTNGWIEDDITDVSASKIRYSFIDDDQYVEVYEIKVYGILGGPAPTYTLTVTNGSGDGDYEEGAVVNISADAAPGGQQFASWTGDISHVADANSANTTVTMPASNVSVTATYEDVSSGTETLSADADAKVRGKSYADDNLGTEGYLTAKDCSDDDYDRHTYIRFDLSGYTNTVNSATLRLKVSNNAGIDGLVFKEVSDDSWDETTITWNNAPAPGNTISTETSLPSAGNWLEVDVTSQVNNEISGDDLITIYFESQNSDCQGISFYSKENGTASNNPQLVIDGGTTTTYALSVTNGSGDGDYEEGTVVNISADAAPSGQQFAAWTGDISHVADANSANTTVTMPASNVSVEATYEDIPVSDISARVEIDPFANDGNVWKYFRCRVYNNSVSESIESIDITIQGAVFDFFDDANNDVFTVSPNGGGHNDGNTVTSVTLSFSSPMGPGGSAFSPTSGNNNDIDQDPISGFDVTVTFSNGATLSGSMTNVGDTDDGDNALWVFDESSNGSPATYTLSVTNGSGDGDYEEGTVVNISANAAPTGQQFASWTGDISHVADANSANTTVTMPASNVSVEATYEDIPLDLPSPWLNTDVGTPAPGNASYNNGTFTVESNGNDIWNSADNFHFVYQSFSGDGSIVAKVESLENTHQWAKAGVMIRETLNSGSKHAFMVVSSQNGTQCSYRTSTGSSSSSATPYDGISAPYWVKLERVGNTFTGYKSSDGSNWTQVGSVTISMGTDVYIGLAGTSHTDGVLCTATYSNVTVTTDGGGGTETLSADADTYVRDDQYESTNFGSEPSLLLKNVADREFDRRAYIRFDLTGYTNSVNSATLRLKVEQNDGLSNIDFSMVSDDSWGESTINWNNAPSVGSLIGTVTPPAAGQWLELDVTSQVNTEISGDGLITIHVENPIEEAGMLKFYSKENGTSANDPQLFVDYGSTKSTPPKIAMENKPVARVLKVFPNPAENFITIQVHEEIFDARIYDINGRLVKILNDVDGLQTLQTHEIGKAGIYFLKVFMENNVEVTKFIIEQ